MTSPTQPRFPVYIPSKSRAETGTTARVLDRLNVPYRLVVEEQQLAEYARHFPSDRLLVLDPQYQRDYQPLFDVQPDDPLGPGPARNFIWEHSISEGHPWHWVMDDNILNFFRLIKNQRLAVADGHPFAAMEDFVLRYTNIAMAGPHYLMFAPARSRRPAFITGTRVYSCNLIRNDVPFRWRGRYNEDTDLSLRMLKGGWNTVVFFAFLQDKLTTQHMGGGNTEAFYAEEGTYRKSEMLRRMHPDVTRLVWRYGRVHHFVDYGQWRNRPLKRRADWTPPAENPYRTKVVTRPSKQRTGVRS